MSGTVLGPGDLAGNEFGLCLHKFLYWVQPVGFILQPILSNIFIDNLEEQIYYMLRSGTEDIKDKGELKLISRVRSGNVKGIWRMGQE